MKPYLNSKVIVVIGIFLVAALALGAYFFAKRTPSSTNPDTAIASASPVSSPSPTSSLFGIPTPLATAQASPTPLASQTPRSLTYTSPDGGFRMTLPKEWEGYSVQEDHYTDPYTFTSLRFSLKTQDDTWFESLGTYDAALLAIDVYSPADWQKISALDEPHPAVIMTTAKYVYTYGKAQDYPSDLDTQFKQIDTFVKTLQEN